MVVNVLAACVITLSVASNNLISAEYSDDNTTFTASNNLISEEYFDLINSRCNMFNKAQNAMYKNRNSDALFYLKLASDYNYRLYKFDPNLSNHDILYHMGTLLEKQHLNNEALWTYLLGYHRIKEVKEDKENKISSSFFEKIEDLTNKLEGRSDYFIAVRLAKQPKFILPASYTKPDNYCSLADPCLDICAFYSQVYLHNRMHMSTDLQKEQKNWCLNQSQAGKSKKI
ncbi:hypothetical protein DRJ17_03830 [Candidatus Woesearchaeota archaeon]|nr:MAG: hypothetical protein DRJ17_03830 [Candidatus Woesearchaeota archaeon]